MRFEFDTLDCKGKGGGFNRLHILRTCNQSMSLLMI